MTVKQETFAFRTIYILMWLLVIASSALQIKFFTDGQMDYSSLAISDWLISYDGGFVRRGLGGTILKGLHTLIPFSVRTTIFILYIVGTVLLTICLWRMFRRNRWSPFMMPFSICMFFGTGLYTLQTRRDYWVLLLSVILFRLASKRHTPLRLMKLNILSVVMILFYEPSFFFTIPLLAITTYFQNTGSTWRRTTAILKVCLPATIAMTAVCLCKGDSDTARAIWTSWQPMMEQHLIGTTINGMGYGTDFLTWSLRDALSLHVSRSWTNEFAFGLPSFPLTIYSFICIYYLVTRLNTVNMHIWQLDDTRTKALSNILIMQFVFMLPLFGFLSCDFGRTIPCWVISSLAATAAFGDKGDISPAFVRMLTDKLQQSINRISLLHNPMTYLVLLVTLPLSFDTGAQLDEMFLSPYIKMLIGYF